MGAETFPSTRQYMIAKGLTVREAAIGLKIGKTTLYDAFRESGTQGASKTRRIIALVNCEPLEEQHHRSDARQNYASRVRFLVIEGASERH